ncbi:hypothetical protein M8C21_030181 [Ambrosia artemisiifolia]|uniref:Uncharacterized protein n=1 Tax=Ambrosia artemisiifolia TaxID=4212 RepID=A0AAD5C0E9_AMBAR|nr:hypothetical protein M8C21_030181 [Ambrosia artemisiifolia]
MIKHALLKNQTQSH